MLAIDHLHTYHHYSTVIIYILKINNLFCLYDNLELNPPTKIHRLGITRARLTWNRTKLPGVEPEELLTGLCPRSDRPPCEKIQDHNLKEAMMWNQTCQTMWYHEIMCMFLRQTAPLIELNFTYMDFLSSHFWFVDMYRSWAAGPLGKIKCTDAVFLVNKPWTRLKMWLLIAKLGIASSGKSGQAWDTLTLLPRIFQL